MAHFTFADMAVKIDNAATTLTDITGSVNSVSFDGTMSVLEDTGLSDTQRTYLPGVADGTISLNGFVDSTTRGIFAPLVNQRTSITKTFELQIAASMFLNGEGYITDVAFSGAPDAIELWSCNLQITGAANSTSAAL